MERQFMAKEPSPHAHSQTGAGSDIFS